MSDMVNSSTNYYRHFLMKELERRQRVNPHYSTRGFARDLDLDIGTLSRVFSSKAGLSLKSGKKIALALKLSKKESAIFLEAIADSRKIRSLQKNFPEQDVRKDDIKLLEHDEFAIISNLYHYAIVELVETDGFSFDLKAIAKKLNLTVPEVEQAVQRLTRVGLLKRDAKGVKKCNEYIATTNRTKTTEALRNHQREILRNALYRLDAESIEKRIMSGMTIPIDQAKLPLARELIDDFCKKMAETMSAGKRNSVYQLHISFCSLLSPSEKI